MYMSKHTVALIVLPLNFGVGITLGECGRFAEIAAAVLQNHSFTIVAQNLLTSCKHGSAENDLQVSF